MSEEETKSEEAKEERKRNSILSGLVKILPFLIVAVAFSVGSFFLIKQKPELLGLSKGTVATQKEEAKLVAEVKKLIALPQDETPTIATVSDVEKLKDQLFFKNAKNGDKVLVYQKAQKAILYRPSEKLVVEVGALNEASQQTTPTTIPSPTASIKPTLEPEVEQ